MVLSNRRRGRAGRFTPAGPACRRALAQERGSQSLEFAMVLPVVAFVLLVILQVAIVGADLVSVQGIAREAARAAAVEGPHAARAVGERAAGGRALRMEVTQDGVDVRVHVELATRALPGELVWLPARATMRKEDL